MGDSKIVVGIGIIAVEPDRVVVVADGAPKLALLGEGDSAILVSGYDWRNWEGCSGFVTIRTAFINSCQRKNWSSGKKYEQSIVKPTFFDQCRWRRPIHGEADRGFGMWSSL
jgi:hypothetical protein